MMGIRFVKPAARTREDISLLQHVRPSLLLHEDHRGCSEICCTAKDFQKKALQVGLKQKASEFVEKGSELYIS